jgi:hypothetical protein
MTKRRWLALAAALWLIPTPAYAHAVGPGGGVDIELLLVAGAAVFFGFKLRSTGQAKPAASWIAIGVGVALAVAAVVVPQGSNPSAPSDASILIVTPADGDTVAADKAIRVEVALTGVSIATSPSDTTKGHIHVYVDGTLEQMPYTTQPKVKLSPGEHEITIEYVDAQHISYNPPLQTSVKVVAES